MCAEKSRFTRVNNRLHHYISAYIGYIRAYISRHAREKTLKEAAYIGKEKKARDSLFFFF
jgi:hypothetical protein